MDWHPVISVQQQTTDNDFVISAFQMYVLHFWAFFENRKNSGLTPGQNDNPVTRVWKMTQMTRWPSDPVPCLVAIVVDNARPTTQTM